MNLKTKKHSKSCHGKFGENLWLEFYVDEILSKLDNAFVHEL